MTPAAAAEAIVAHIAAHCPEIDPLVAAVPVAPVAGGGYVWPGGDRWAEPDEDSPCRWRVSLSLDLLASVVDLQHSQSVLAERAWSVLAACAGGIEVGGDRAVATSLGTPVVVSATGGELLAVRIDFSPISIEVPA